MDIFFQNPDEVPLPMEEMRILDLQVTPWDNRRLHVFVEVTPFQRRPNLQLTLLDAEGQTRAEVSILEPMTRKLELTMHMRGPEVQGTLRLQAVLFYEEPIQPGNEPDAALLANRPAPRVVDTAETLIELAE
ncbi:MAG: hypothetical protein OHK0052_26400 [Anaerolineales bacterium]